MTEEEARTRWCPMARLNVGNDTAAPYNRYLHSDEYDMALPGARKCVASDCALWVVDYRAGSSVMDVRGPDVEDGGHCGLVK